MISAAQSGLKTGIGQVTHKHKTNRSYSKKHPGFWPCKVDPRCGCCKNYDNFRQSVTNSETGESVTLRQHTTCQTSNVVYLVSCRKCNEQYVGETCNCVRWQANQHRSDIKLEQKNIPTVRHFRRCGPEHFKLTILQRVRSRKQKKESTGELLDLQAKTFH